MKLATLCYLIDTENNLILLGKKKYGGAKGKLNGFGGKFEDRDVSIIDSVRREFLEETSIKLISPVLSAVIFFHPGSTKETAIVYVYKCESWEGTAQESNEMSVHWYKKARIPIDQMWPSDSIWFPLIMNHSNLIIHLSFEDGNELPKEISVKFNQKLYENIHKDAN